MKYRPAPEGASNRGGGAARPLAGLISGYLLLMAVVFVLASFVGSSDLVTARGVWQAWRGDGTPETLSLWFDFRLAPLFLAAVVGAGLALAGTVFQAVLRNPLAEPYILGISGAAALGAFAGRLLLPSNFGVSLFAFTGALAATLLLLGLARWARFYDPASLILAGAVLNAIFGAAILLCYSVAPEGKVVSSLIWLMGSIDVVTALRGYPVWSTVIAVGLAWIAFSVCARPLDLLSLGEEDAADLGLSPRPFRFAALLGASLLTGVVAAAAGPIGFVGLVVPHIMRRLHGPSHRGLVPLSILGGAIFVMLAYTISRTAVPSRPLPLGAITALVGGPFFLLLLLRRREAGGM